MQVEQSVIQALKNVGMPEEITPILSDRVGVEPNAPYLIVQIVSTHNVALPRVTTYHEDGNVTESIFQVKDFNFSLTFHADARSPVHDWVQYFQTGLTDSDLVSWAFSQQGLGIVRDDGIMYQSSPVDTVNYKRAIMNITFRAEVLQEYIVNNMSRIVFEGSLEDSIAGRFGEVVTDTTF